MDRLLMAKHLTPFDFLRVFKRRPFLLVEMGLLLLIAVVLNAVLVHYGKGVWIVPIGLCAAIYASVRIRLVHAQLARDHG